MSADVKQSSDTSNFLAPKLARWYQLFFFAMPFGMPMGRVASQFLAKVTDWFGHNRDFRVRGQGFRGSPRGLPEHENVDCDQTNLFFFLKIGLQHAPWAYQTA